LPASGRTVAASFPLESSPVVETGEGGGPGAAGGAALPCLSSNICTAVREIGRLRTLQPGHKKTADLLAKAVEEMCRRHGIERVGFLTLTFADHVKDPKEAQRRWHSLRTHVLKPRYGDVIRVIERQMSGRIHYHVLVALKDDVRTGADFDAFAKRDYKSANAALRAEWAFWRKTAPRFRFGRTELLPVKSNAEGLSRYVGKYISKHINVRKLEDKGVRLVEYTRGARVGNTRFSWVSTHAKLWRAKLHEWASKHGLDSYEQISSVFGPRWAYHHREAIFASDWEMFVESRDAAFELQQSGELSWIPEDWSPGPMSKRSFKLAEVAPIGAVFEEFKKFVESSLVEVAGHTATAAKRSAEVPPKPLSAEEPPEALSPLRNAPKKYSLASKGGSDFRTLRPQHVEQRPLNFTRHKPTDK